MASRANRILIGSVSVGLALCVSSIASANETFPTVHDAPITVQILSGLDGKPVPKAHLVAIAGYDEGDLRLQTWHEEALTDSDGKAHFSNRISNLPFLQVWVANASLCQSKPRSEAFSVDRVRRDGLSTPNRCGVITAVDEPGTFTVFVKPSRKLLFPKSASAIPPGAAVSEVGLPIPSGTPAPVTSSPNPTAAKDVSSVPAGVAGPATAMAAEPPAPAPVAAEPAKQPIQPAKEVSASPLIASPANQPMGSSVPVAPTTLAQVAPQALTATPLTQAQAPPLGATAARAVQPPMPAAQAASQTASIPPGKSASSTPTGGAARRPVPGRALSRRNASTRRVAPKTDVGVSPAEGTVAASNSPAASESAAKAQPVPSPATKAAILVPPAPKIPVSLEAAPSPPPSAAADGRPRPKPAASRRRGIEYPSPAARRKHKPGAAPKESVSTSAVPPSTAPVRKE